MCLYPKLLKNPKYKPNKKNGGQVPAVPDNRVLYVPVGCGGCMECMKKKARDWKARLMEEIKIYKSYKFVTLTFSTEKLKELNKKIHEKYEIPKGMLWGYELDNRICTEAVRYFTERWRKATKKAPRHWLITEIGGGRYEHVHLHGLIHGGDKLIKSKWDYGYVFIGDYVNEKSINYMVKYMHKVDEKHRHYKPIVLCSKGIGGNYKHEKKDNEFYRTRQGKKIGLPIYWRNKIYTDKEKEQLWLEKLDKQERWVNGIRIDVSTKKGQSEYLKVQKQEQQKNVKLGYKQPNDWKTKVYEEQRRAMLQKERLNASGGEYSKGFGYMIPSPKDENTSDVERRNNQGLKKKGVAPAAGCNILHNMIMQYDINKEKNKNVENLIWKIRKEELSLQKYKDYVKQEQKFRF